MKYLFLFVLISYSFHLKNKIVHTSELRIIKDNIFSYMDRMGHNFEHCSEYLGYPFDPNSGNEQSKCFISIIKEKEPKKLQLFLDFLQMYT